MLRELEEVPFSTSDGSDDLNRASLIDALRRFVDGYSEEPAAPDPLIAVTVFRYEGGDLNYEPLDSAPPEWDGNLNDLIGDYVRLDDHQRRVEALKHEQMVKVTAEFMRAEKAEAAFSALFSDEVKGALYDAHMRYQNVDPREQSEDGWAECLLHAIQVAIEQVG